MTRPEASGERFLAVADGTMTLQVRRCSGAWQLVLTADSSLGFGGVICPLIE